MVYSNREKETKMTPMVSRMVQAAKLEASVYEEAARETTLTAQALWVVVLSSVAAGLGIVAQVGSSGILVGTVAAMLSWYVWAVLIYFIGTRLLPEQKSRPGMGSMLRAIGFASVPGIFRVLGLIPGVGRIVFPLAGIWMLAAMVIAARAALNYSSIFRAIGVCLLSWVVQVMIFLLLLSLLGGVPAGVR